MTVLIRRGISKNRRRAIDWYVDYLKYLIANPDEWGRVEFDYYVPLASLAYREFFSPDFDNYDDVENPALFTNPD